MTSDDDMVTNVRESNPMKRKGQPVKQNDVPVRKRTKIFEDQKSQKNKLSSDKTVVDESEGKLEKEERQGKCVLLVKFSI